ncbi:MAG: ATP-binding protein [Thermoplasmata archaeon]|nr:ATP-binding protein [Thermoplasmata archaeon]
MLIRFTLENYKCFKDSTTLNLKASPDRLHPHNLYVSEDGKTKLLRSASIYGSNASGKTTVLAALSLMKDFVMNSNMFDPALPLNHMPFAFDPACTSKPTSFEAEFIHGGIRYIYGFSYDSEKISEEHLFSYPNGKKKMAFVRDGQNYRFNSDVKIRTDISKRMDPKKLYASFASQFNDAECKAVHDWFSNGLITIVNYNVGSSLEMLFDTMNRDPDFKGYVLKALRIADFGITDLRDNMQLINVTPAAMAVRMHDYRAQHTVDGKDRLLPLAAESNGTIRFLAVIGPVISALLNGLTLCVDEMDMSFHTDLCKWIIGLFHDPEQNAENAQLIFNTHDPELLDQTMVRRDQVWMTNKDANTSESTLNNLTEYRVRNDLDIRKAYINGSLGGTPFIESEMLI